MLTQELVLSTRNNGQNSEFCFCISAYQFNKEKVLLLHLLRKEMFKRFALLIYDQVPFDDLFVLDQRWQTF